jgi:hypothetical protein
MQVRLPLDAPVLQTACNNKVQLQLHALSDNLATFLRCIELRESIANWSLTSLQLKLIKIGRAWCATLAPSLPPFTDY